MVVLQFIEDRIYLDEEEIFANDDGLLELVSRNITEVIGVCSPKIKHLNLQNNQISSLFNTGKS